MIQVTGWRNCLVGLGEVSQKGWGWALFMFVTGECDGWPYGRRRAASTPVNSSDISGAAKPWREERAMPFIEGACVAQSPPIELCRFQLRKRWLVGTGASVRVPASLPVRRGHTWIPITAASTVPTPYGITANSRSSTTVPINCMYWSHSVLHMRRVNHGLLHLAWSRTDKLDALSSNSGKDFRPSTSAAEEIDASAVAPAPNERGARPPKVKCVSRASAIATKHRVRPTDSLRGA